MRQHIWNVILTALLLAPTMSLAGGGPGHGVVSYNDKPRPVANLTQSPVPNPSYSAVFFDESYPDDPAAKSPAQHLGVDIPVPSGSAVLSPVSGVLISNQTDPDDPWNSRVVIRAENGDEHVLGHINSSIKAQTSIDIGDPVGTILTAGSGPHLHWGVNTIGVQGAMGGGWGWGRAPVTTTLSEANKKGWIDPRSLLN
ncbi:M23 family metallopeptidase [uncultured Roseobacter sp.]|uniref:M23 family metallopeptidase n=1 Tax=uncultured Roseobacter sp. TaxID=114847 RepID=UPI002631C178|nr:M23 family metallopeptidase [uncultured Roseobacter sp.]